MLLYQSFTKSRAGVGREKCNVRFMKFPFIQTSIKPPQKNSTYLLERLGEAGEQESRQFLRSANGLWSPLTDLLSLGGGSGL